MTADGFTQGLARWIAAPRAPWPAAAIDEAERAIVDTIACMIAGAGEAAVQRVRAGLAGWGDEGAASAIRAKPGRDAPWAAMINGTAAHALDYDDVLDPASSHPSAVLVPALLALGEEIEASGADLVDAYVVGLEVEECLAEAANMVHYARGWHTTLSFGAPAAAAACAQLLRLDATGARHAISLATSFAGGFKRQFGTDAKPFHAGLAAKNGIVAARMAAAGLTADPAAFEGARGFLDLMVGPGSAGFAEALRRLHGPPAIVAPGVWLKRYPCCASAHRALDGLRATMRAHGLAPADVAGVEAVVPEIDTRNLMYAAPETPMQARFSMGFCLATGLLDGDVTVGSFAPQAIGRADVGALLARIVMTSDPEQPADMPSTRARWAHVIVTTRDGRRIATKVTDPEGYPRNPLGEAALAAKFHDCAHGQPEVVGASLTDWRSIAAAPTLRRLGRILRDVATT